MKKLVRSLSFTNLMCAASALAMCTTAQAASYEVDYSSPTGAFAATLTTADAIDMNGFSLLTGLSGTRNGLSLSLLSLNAYGGNDNLFKPTADYVDSAGFSFTDGVNSYNVYLGTVTGLLHECTTPMSCGFIDDPRISSFTVSTADVPEPATWAMMVAGFGVIGSALRRRGKVSTTVRFA